MKMQLQTFLRNRLLQIHPLVHLPNFKEMEPSNPNQSPHHATSLRVLSHTREELVNDFERRLGNYGRPFSTSDVDEFFDIRRRFVTGPCAEDCPARTTVRTELFICQCRAKVLCLLLFHFLNKVFFGGYFTVQNCRVQIQFISRNHPSWIRQLNGRCTTDNYTSIRRASISLFEQNHSANAEIIFDSYM